jgi:hypothetical protein
MAMRQLSWIVLVVCAACSTALAENDVYLTEAIKNQIYAQALSNLLKASHGLPPWTQQTLKPTGDYVGVPRTFSTAGSTNYELFNTCKPHACSDNQLVIMFAPNGAQAWAAYAETGKPILFLGAPSAEQQSALKAALQH